MLFHFCGSFLHDIIHNALVILLMAPEWMPWGTQLKQWIKERHQHG